MLLIELVEKYGGTATTIKDKVTNALPYIFDFTFPMYDNAYLTVLERKIVLHYLYYECCYYDEEQWKLALETKLNEDMPLFNQRYASTLVQINPLYTTQLTTARTTAGTHTGSKSSSVISSGSDVLDEDVSRERTNSHGETQQSNSHETSTSTNGSTTTNNAHNESVERESDTPMGNIQSLDDGYLTNAKKTNSTSGETVTANGTNGNISDGNGQVVITGQENGGDSEQRDSTRTTSQTVTESGSDSLTTTENYIDSVAGNSGISQSELIAKWREIFINIDKEIINSLKSLFILVF